MADRLEAQDTHELERVDSEPPRKKPRMEDPQAPDASKYNFWSEEDVLHFFELQEPEEVDIAKPGNKAGVDKERLKKLLQELIRISWRPEADKDQSCSVDGKCLDKLALLTEDDYLFGISSYKYTWAEVSKIVSHVKTLQQQQYVVFNDPIHGSIKLHPLLVKIVDTPEFQRLRHIKQLGGVCYVYPGAMHTIFAHSIGICYIAGELGRSLQANSPNLGISDKDVLCLQIAALCCKLGQGPFSHVFVDVARRILNAEALEWKSELVARKLFGTIYKRKEQDFQHYGLKQEDAEVIFEQLEGKGTPTKKRFLYQVLVNKRNGIDVDMWDCFARDCYYLGIPNDFQWRRWMSLAHVAAPEENPDDQQICLRDKEVENVCSFLHTWSTLRLLAYKHKTTRVVEHMLEEALVLAKDVELFHPRYKDAEPRSLKKALKAAATDHEMSDFLLLTDDIRGYIMNARCSPDNEDMKKAKELLTKIEKRQLYHFLHSIIVPATKVDVVKSESPRDLAWQMCDPDSDVKCDMHIDVVTISYPSEKDHSDASSITPAASSTPQAQPQNRNPLKDARFYTKSAPWIAVPVDFEQEISQLRIPRTFSETQLRVYCKTDDTDRQKLLSKNFAKWAKEKLGIEVKSLMPYMSRVKGPDPSSPRQPLNSARVLVLPDPDEKLKAEV